MPKHHEKEMRNLEDILARIGNANRFQVLMVLFGRIPGIANAWSMFEMSFGKAEPKWCCVPEHVNVTPAEYCFHGKGTFGNNCPDDPTNNCSYRLFEDNMDTVVNEWDLVCDQKWKINLSVSLQMAGVLVGALIAGYMADILGRKKTFFISIFLLTASSLGAGFSTSWMMFNVFRVVMGLSNGLYLVVNIPYIMEFISTSKRNIPPLIPVYQIGCLLMTLSAWLLPQWRWVHWINAAITFPCLLFMFFMPESLRWLTIKGKLKEAERVVAIIARINGKVVPEGFLPVLKEVYKQECTVEEIKTKTSYSYLDIYRGWPLFKLSVVLQIIWFSFSFCAYGIIYGASTLDLDLYLNMVLISSVSVPVVLVMQVAMMRIGRKAISLVLLSFGTLFGIGALVVYLKVPDEDHKGLITNILCLTTNGLLGGAWASIMVLSSESYPTVLRSLGYAAANTVSRVGGILAPFAFDFKSMPVLAYALMAGFMGFCTLMVLTLKETRGLTMPDTLLEVKKARACAQRDSGNDDETTLLLGAGNDQKQTTYEGINGIVPDESPHVQDI